MGDSVNLNQLNPSGLAQLAGGVHVPNLNLPLWGNQSNPGAINLEAAKQAALLNQAREQAQMQNELGMFKEGQANIRNEQTVKGGMLNAQIGAQARLADAQLRSHDADLTRQQQASQFGQTFGLDQTKAGIEQQKADQLGAYQQQQVDISRDTLKTTQEKNYVDKVHTELMDRAKITEEARQAKAAFAGSYLSEVAAVAPEDREAFDHAFVQRGVSAGVISDKDGAAFLSAPVEQRAGMAKMDYLLTEKASELAKLQNPSGTGGTINVTTSDGTQINYSPLAKGAMGSTQQDAITKQKQAATLDQIEKKVTELQNDPETANIFTRKGNLDYDMSVSGEYNKSIPVYGSVVNAAANLVTGKDDKQREKYIEKTDEVRTMVTQLFNAYRKDITGAAASEQELARLEKAYLNNNMSASQYVARMKVIRNQGLRELGIDKEAMSKGIETQRTEAKQPSFEEGGSYTNQKTGQHFTYIDGKFVPVGG